MDQGTEGRRPRKVSDIYRGRVRQDGPIIVQTGKLTLATGELQIESEEDRLKNRVDDEEDEEDEGGGEEKRSARVRAKAVPRDPAQEGQQNLGGDVWPIRICAEIFEARPRQRRLRLYRREQ